MDSASEFTSQLAQLAERRAFVILSLAALGAWIVLYSARAMLARHRSRWAFPGAAAALGLCLIAVAAAHGWSHPEMFRDRSGVNTMFIVLIALLFSSLAVRPILSLFDSRFSLRRPGWGVVAIASLMTVWYLPLWRTEIVSLLHEAGISSFKASFVELSFRDASPAQAAVQSAGAAGVDVSEAVARPSNPRPGLSALAAELAGTGKGDSTIERDVTYMTYLGVSLDEAAAQREIIGDTNALLAPLKPLAECLKQYVEIFPDSHLLLVDVRPAIAALFMIHARAQRAFASRPQDTEILAKQAEKVRANVLETIKKETPETTPDHGKTPATVDYKELETLERSCGSKRDNENFAAASSLVVYYQPYTVIALANLLTAYSAQDEALEVMAQWLDMWRCARGDVAGGSEGCGTDLDRKSPEAVREAVRKLPEWLGLRMELEINTLLYSLAGESSITYRNFLTAHQSHLAAYLAKSGHPMDIASELSRCNKEADLHEAAPAAWPHDPDVKVRALLFRTLLQNENTLLRAEAHYLSDKELPELPGIYERSKLLASTRVGCFHPIGNDEKEYWEGVVKELLVTQGIVGLGVSERINAVAASSDDRDRALTIRNEAKAALREGYNALFSSRKIERRRIAGFPLSERVFKASNWEGSYQLALRATQQLNNAEH